MKILRRATFACLLLLSVGVFGVYAITYFRPAITCGCPAPSIWTYQYNQASLQYSHGEFALKEIEITPQELHFFYVYTFSHPGVPTITSVSKIDGSSALPLRTSVQPLGVLGDVHIGVIHAQLIDRVNQDIELDISPPGDGTQHWRLTPLKQGLSETHSGASTYIFANLEPLDIPTVTLNGPLMKEQVAYFLLTLPGHSTTAADYLFLRTDHPTRVTLITREQFLAIAGSQNLQP